MRTIKFRGIDAETGDTVYGYPVIYDSGKFTHWFYRPTEDSNCPVKPETIAQLIYVDTDGTEYYEGDTINKDGRTWRARLQLYMEETIHAAD